MGKPQNKVKIKWSPNFAYAIGLLTTDGCLSSNGRQFDFTSKDMEQIVNFKKALNIQNKISEKKSGIGKLANRVQFGDVNFYKFLLTIGLMPKKSKTVAEIDVPDKYFFDFLRGHFDGDGTFYSYWDPRWKSSFMFYTYFISASKRHINWLKNKMKEKLNINGHISHSKNRGTFDLRYAKTESLKLLPKIYPHKEVLRLNRKYLKIRRALAIIGKQDLI